MADGVAGLATSEMAAAVNSEAQGLRGVVGMNEPERLRCRLLIVTSFAGGPKYLPLRYRLEAGVLAARRISVRRMPCSPTISAMRKMPARWRNAARFSKRSMRHEWDRG